MPSLKGVAEEEEGLGCTEVKGSTFLGTSLTASISGEQRGEDAEKTGKGRGRTDKGELARNERTRWRHRAGRMISTRWQVSIIYHLCTIKKYTLTMGRAQNKLNSNSKAYGNKMQQFKRL